MKQKKTLLNKTDMLFSNVRDCSRIYLIFSRTFVAVKKSQIKNKIDDKRKWNFKVNTSSYSMSIAISELSQLSSSSSFSRSSKDFVHDKIMHNSYSWKTHKWSYIYENDTKLIDRAKIFEISDVYFLHLKSNVTLLINSSCMTNTLNKFSNSLWLTAFSRSSKRNSAKCRVIKNHSSINLKMIKYHQKSSHKRHRIWTRVIFLSRAHLKNWSWIQKLITTTLTIIKSIAAI